MVKWKREKVQDHKFDFVDVAEFEKKDFVTRISYTYVFLIVLKSVLVYLADLYNAVVLIRSTSEKVGVIQPKIPFRISKWIFVASIAISFILLFIEVRKAKRIIASGDISYAFTSIIATRYYSLTSYAHWCFFQEIKDQQRLLDKIAFFVFFSFKGWKRLIFCDGPRQIINALTLYAIVEQKKFSTNIVAYSGDLNNEATMGVMIFTVTVFAVSTCLLLIAFLMYLPLLCKIQGNLKEYCCYVIDKRIAELLKKHRKNRRKDGVTLKAPKHLDGKTPTLPTIEDGSFNKEPYPQMPPQMRPQHDISPQISPQMRPQHDISPVALNNYGRMPSPSEGPYIGGSNELPRMPIYNTRGQPIGTEQYPPRPDSNNSNSTYSDTSTIYSAAQVRPPYPYPPQPPQPPQQQYPFRQIPGYKYILDQENEQGGGFNNKRPIPYGHQNSNQYYNQNHYDDEEFNNYASSQNSPREAQFPPIENARPPPPPQRSNMRYQQNQNRPYNKY